MSVQKLEFQFVFRFTINLLVILIMLASNDAMAIRTVSAQGSLERVDTKVIQQKISILQQEQNIALGADTSESDPGWGGGAYPQDMVDGLTYYMDTWAHGLAFTGGTGSWAGQPCGWRQTTLNLKSMKTFNHVFVWHHGQQHIPNTYGLEYWDGNVWQVIGGTSQVRQDLSTETDGKAGAIPTEHVFPRLTGSKIRFVLNNCDIEHGWIYEFQVFDSVNLQVNEVHPNQGRSDLPNDIYVNGEKFTSDMKVYLGSIPLINVVLIDEEMLRATIPADVLPGVYDLIVENNTGVKATLTQAYTVLSPNNVDVYAVSDELMVDPNFPHAGSTTRIALTVHRIGGKDLYPEVKVIFYLGDPNNGGTKLGESSVLMLAPETYEVTEYIYWNPISPGNYEIYAKIDPDNQINEIDKNNNIVHRPVVVLAPYADQIGPHVDRFWVNDIEGGFFNISSRDMVLKVSASDPSPSSGMGMVLFAEYEYNQSIQSWVRVQSKWVSYNEAASGYNWKLMPSLGLKYLKAWAKDNAGNMSYPYRVQLNYVPPSDKVGAGQSRILRYHMEAGQHMLVNVHPLSGDPDLFVWPPDYNSRGNWVSNMKSGDDWVDFFAPVTGEYQVEVKGYTDAEYILTVEQLASDQVSLPKNTQYLDGSEGGREPTKTIPTHPILENSNYPSDKLALPPAPATYRQFVPITTTYRP